MSKSYIYSGFLFSCCCYCIFCLLCSIIFTTFTLSNNNIKFKYEEHHRVRYTPEAIEAAVKLSNRYITDRHLPDKAIDLLDEAGAKARIATMHQPSDMTQLEVDAEKMRVGKGGGNGWLTKKMRFSK